MKVMSSVHSAPQGHWVGDGFPVRSLFSYGKFGNEISPFLLLDYALGEFDPSDRPRGVETHPHKGFETVTIVYQGGLRHRDSSGNVGEIGPGDVQWMTAGSGVLHEEMHSPEFTRTGGKFQVVQLWVNLPAKDKLVEPGYQDLRAGDIPIMALDGLGSTARVVSGSLNGVQGLARTFSSVNIWDVRLKEGADVELPVPDGQIAVFVVLEGSARVESEVLGPAEFALYGVEAAGIWAAAVEDSIVLLLAGEPLNEPIAGYGPFVMNTQEEIRQTISDFQAGKFGSIPVG